MTQYTRAEDMAILKGGPRNGEMINLGGTAKSKIVLPRIPGSHFPDQIPSGMACTYRNTGNVGSHGEKVYEYDPEGGF